MVRRNSDQSSDDGGVLLSRSKDASCWSRTQRPPPAVVSALLSLVSWSIPTPSTRSRLIKGFAAIWKRTDLENDQKKDVARDQDDSLATPELFGR